VLKSLHLYIHKSCAVWPPGWGYRLATYSFAHKNRGIADCKAAIAVVDLIYCVVDIFELWIVKDMGKHLAVVNKITKGNPNKPYPIIDIKILFFRYLFSYYMKSQRK